MSINSRSFDEELYNKRRESAVTNFTSFQESFNSWSENDEQKELSHEEIVKIVEEVFRSWYNSLNDLGSLFSRIKLVWWREHEIQDLSDEEISKVVEEWFWSAYDSLKWWEIIKKLKGLLWKDDLINKEIRRLKNSKFKKAAEENIKNEWLSLEWWQFIERSLMFVNRDKRLLKEMERLKNMANEEHKIDHENNLKAAEDLKTKFDLNINNDRTPVIPG